MELSPKATLREDLEVIEIEDGRTELRHLDGTPEKCLVEIPATGFAVCPHGIQFVWASVLAQLQADEQPADEPAAEAEE